jgi:hypothetical protein
MNYSGLYYLSKRKLTSFPKRQVERFFNRRVSKNDNLRNSIFQELEHGIKRIVGTLPKADYGLHKKDFGLSNPPIQQWIGNGQTFLSGNAGGRESLCGSTVLPHGKTAVGGTAGEPTSLARKTMKRNRSSGTPFKFTVRIR